jgi:hypothetical protein
MMLACAELQSRQRQARQVADGGHTEVQQSAACSVSVLALVEVSIFMLCFAVLLNTTTWSPAATQNALLL